MPCHELVVHIRMRTSPREMDEYPVIRAPGWWARLQAAFEATLELDGAEEREALLERTLADSPELQEQVRAMLRAHECGPPLDIEKRLLNDGGWGDGAWLGGIIGAYRLERLLGRGGMSEVYLAERREPQFRQRVAVKLLRSGWHAPDALARFRLERQILAKLNHPQIAPLLDGGVTEDGRPYLVLQYIQGRPITEYCRQKGVPLEERLRLFCEVARAVGYAHRNLIVHRDLKPANILVTEDGQIRLLDFGIAKVLEPAVEEIELPATRAESRLMTRDYAAPEQILGGTVTTATDVYALGVLLYELLAGRRPFTAEDCSRVDLERRIVEREPAPPSRAVGESRMARRLRGDLDAIVLKALRKEPESRYPSAGEMALDVERYLAGQPIEVRGPSFGYRFGKLVRRNKIASALTAACALLLVGLAATATYQSRRIARARDLARLEQQKAERVVGVLSEMLAAANPRNVPQGSQLTLAEFLKQTERMVLESRNLETPVQARLKHLLGTAYLERSEFAEARALLEDALRQTLSAYGQEAEATAAVLHDLARLARYTEPTDKAIPLLRQSLERHLRLFGEQHEKVAECLRELGMTLPVSEESRTLLERALTIERALSAGPNPGIAASLAALGRYHLLAGDLKPAEQFFSDALTMLNQLFPQGHPASLSAASNLAAVYQRQGRFVEAAELNAALIELKARLIGPESIPVAIGFNNLGTALAANGDHQKAEDAFRRALALYVRLLGPEHAEIANTTRNVAALRSLQGDYSQAQALLRKVIAMQHRLGAPEALLWELEAELGTLTFRSGRRAEGLRRLRTALEKLKALLPPGNDSIASVQVCLGFALLESGAARGAEALFREALVFRRAHLPTDHPAIAQAECGLGGALVLLGRRREGEELLARKLPAFRSWGLAHPVDVRLLERHLAGLRHAEDP